MNGCQCVDKLGCLNQNPILVTEVNDVIESAKHSLSSVWVLGCYFCAFQEQSDIANTDQSRIVDVM